MSGDFGNQQFQRQQFKHRPRDLPKSKVDHDAIREKLKVPARGLLFSGIASVTIVFLATLAGLVFGSVQKEQMAQDLHYRIYGEEELDENVNRRNQTDAAKEREEQRNKQLSMIIAMLTGGVIISAMLLASVYFFSVSGGLLMGQLKNYKVCRLACIIAIIPVLSPLLVVGIPFGLMGLAKLRDPDVKKAFS